MEKPAITPEQVDELIKALKAIAEALNSKHGNITQAIIELNNNVESSLVNLAIAIEDK